MKLRMQRAYRISSLFFLTAGLGLFIAGEVSAAVGDEHGLSTFVVQGFPGCLFIGIGLLLAVFAVGPDIVCPWCGQAGTFGDTGNADVCSNCGFDFRKDDY